MLHLKLKHKFAFGKISDLYWKNDGANWTQHSSWAKLGVHQELLSITGEGRGGSLTPECSSVVSLGRINLATYLSSLYNLRTELLFLYTFSFSPKQGSVSSRLHQSQGLWSYLRLPEIVIHITVRLLCCWWGFFPSVSFYLFLTGRGRRGSRGFLALRHVTWDKRPLFLSLLPSNPTSCSAVFHRINC